MKINYKNKDKYKFEDLKVGDVFTYTYCEEDDSCLAMKCDNSTSLEPDWFVDLEESKIYYWDDDYHVVDIINCELNEV